MVAEHSWEKVGVFSRIFDGLRRENQWILGSAVHMLKIIDFFDNNYFRRDGFARSTELTTQYFFANFVFKMTALSGMLSLHSPFLDFIF